MQGSNVVEGFGLAGQAERLLALPGPFHVIKRNFKDYILLHFVEMLRHDKIKSSLRFEPR